MAVGHHAIFDALNKAVGDTKHKCEHDPFPSSKNNVSSATIRVRARHRPSAKELVENWLKVYAKKNGLSYEEKDYPSISSHECIEIDGFLMSAKTQTLRNKEKLRIFFKFLDGTDKPDYSDIWNSGLHEAFKNSSKNIKITPKNDYEVEVMTTINKRIEELGNGAGIKLKVGDGRYHEKIVGCVGAKGNKHADLVLVDIKGNEKIFVSYKNGSTATSFQQYSGITKRAGKTIASHIEVKQWVKDIEDNWDAEQKESPKITLHRSISNDNLKKKAVWGHEVGAGGGYNNCNIFAQGKPKIDDSSTGRYKLEFTKVVNKGNLTKLTGDYDPTLGARKGEAYRKVGSKSGVRGGIFSLGYLTKRKNKPF